MMKKKVLWVEDSARLELRNLLGPVFISGDYDLNLAEDATDAIRKLPPSDNSLRPWKDQSRP